MSWYAIKQFLQYKWIAKTRHGIHSPFVYNFIDQVLLRTKPGSITQIEQEEYLAKYKKLLLKTGGYYNCKSIFCINDAADLSSMNLSVTYDLIWINLLQPDIWIKVFDTAQPYIYTDSILAVSNIHKSPQHTSHWAALCENQKVKLSIDLFGIGLLFFRDDFKVKQHFVLQY